MFEGQVSTIGGGGLTVILKVQLVLLPAASLAVQVTVFVPFGNVLPEGGLQKTDGFGVQLSPAIGVG
jgi:hypothetical protein